MKSNTLHFKLLYTLDQTPHRQSYVGPRWKVSRRQLHTRLCVPKKGLRKPDAEIKRTNPHDAPVLISTESILKPFSYLQSLIQLRCCLVEKERVLEAYCPVRTIVSKVM